ncbi:MAG: hypothetical protein ABIH82_01810, partial [Candidatus Woesearchaeota archaeon]
MKINMITAKLIKSLEQEGFALDFPNYNSNEERILEILKENNERLLLALPLLLKYTFDYEDIKKNLSKKNLLLFNEMILITEKIFIKEKMGDSYLKKIIKKYSLKEKIDKKRFDYFYGSFQGFIKNNTEKKEEQFEELIDIRGKLNLNQALSKIYSPGKLRIMEKIFKHEKLNNTELKYYYRSIRPLILAILNENLQKYVRVIESTKKYS